MDTQKHLHKRRLLDGGDQGPHNRLQGLLLLISGLMFTLESFQSVSVDPDRFFLGRHYSLLITYTAGQAVGAILGGLVSQSNQLLKALYWTYAIAFIGFAAQQAAPAAAAADGGRSGWAGGAGALLGGAGAAGAAVAGAAALAAAAAAAPPRRRAALLAIAYLFSSLGPILSSLIKSLTPAWSRAAAVALALAPGALLPCAAAAAAAAAPPVGAGGKAGGGGGGEEEEEEEKEEEAPAPLRLYRRPLLILMTLWFLQGFCLQGIATIVTDLFKGYTVNTESHENGSAVSAIQNSMLLACFQALGTNLALRALAGPKAARHGSGGPVLAAAAAAAAAAGAEGGSAATSATARRTAALATALGAAAAGLLAAAAAGGGAAGDAGGEGVKVAYCTIQGATFAAGAILLVWTLESIPMHLRAKGLGFTIAASYVGCLSSLALFNSSLNDDDGIIGHVFSYIGNGKRLPLMCCSAASATLGALIALVVMRRRVFFEGGDSKLSAVSDTCEAATTYRSFSLPAETMCGS